MNKLLSTMVSLTIGGSVAICVLALITHLSRARYAARWRCWAWLLLGLRLAIPMSIQLPEQVGIQRPIQIPAPTNTVVYTYEPDEPQSHTPVVPRPEATLPANPSTGAEVTPSQTDNATAPNREVTLYEVTTIVWIVGVIAMLNWYLISHLRFLRYLCRWGNPVLNDGIIRLYNSLGDQLELHRRPNLRLCTGLSAPMLVGMFHPKLLLPEGELSDNDIRYSLLHELTHFKRRDIWLKTLVLWVNALHWFNPLMWYMTQLVERDMELACDEAALKMLPREEHGAYGRTLLDTVERLKAVSA